MRLLALLHQANAISRAHAEEARHMQIVYGNRIGTNLLARGIVREQVVAQALGALHGVPFAAGSDADARPAFTRGLHRSVAEKLHAVPARVDHDVVWMFMTDPQNPTIVAELTRILHKRVAPVVVCEARMWSLLHKFYMVRRPTRVALLDDPPQERHRIRSRAADRAEVSGRVQAPASDLDDASSTFRQIPATNASFDDPSTTAFPLIAANALEDPTSSFAGTNATTQPSHLEDPTSSNVGLLSWLTTLPEGPRTSSAMQATQFVAPAGVDEELLLDELEAVDEAPPIIAGELIEEKPPRDVTPISFDEAKRLLATAEDRDAIALIVLRSCLSVFARAMLLTVQRGYALGWDGIGKGMDAVDVAAISVPLKDPSIFRLARDSKAHFLGPIPKERDNILFLKQTGAQIPKSVLVVPIVVRSKVVNLLYCDNGAGQHVSTDIGEMLLVAQAINRSYEALLKGRDG